MIYRTFQLVRAFVTGTPARSGKWPKVRKDWLAYHPRCEACGKDHDLEVHHIKPYHLYPEFELEPGNLMTLCRRCHLLCGHCDLWEAWNPSVKADAAWLLKRNRERLYTRVFAVLLLCLPGLGAIPHDVALCEHCGKELATTQVSILREKCCLYDVDLCQPLPYYEEVGTSRRCHWHAYDSARLPPIEQVQKYNQRLCEWYGYEYQPRMVIP